MTREIIIGIMTHGISTIFWNTCITGEWTTALRKYWTLFMGIPWMVRLKKSGKSWTITKRKEYYNYVYDKNRNFLASLEEIRQGYGGMRMIPCHSYRFLIYRHNYRFNQKKEMNQVFYQWMKYYSMIHNLVLINQDTVKNRLDNDYDWSLALLAFC